MAEDAAGDDDLEENGALAEVFKLLNIHNQHTEESGRNSQVQVRVDFAKLPCGHQMATDYVVAWLKYSIKQKKTEFSCPRFNDQGQPCSGKHSYQDICQLIPLTEQQRKYLEEKLEFLIYRILNDIKTCPGCKSCVERQDQGNLCVHCTICTSKLNRKYNFCWTCRREWKGLIFNAERCANVGCGEMKRLIPCTPEFKKNLLGEKQNDIYPVRDASTDRKRLALLINNVEFKNLNHRAGAEKDEQSIEVLLKGLGYTVITLRDLSNQGMLDALKDFAQREEHDKSDSCFVVLMSHGDARGICGVFDSFKNKDEEDVFQEDEIFVWLNTLHCAKLSDKPKIILIQSCRGDTVSYRNRKEGSPFIQETVKIFNQHAHQDDIEKLFRKAKSHC